MEKRRLNTSTSSLGYDEPTKEELTALDPSEILGANSITKRGPNRAQRRKMTSMRTIGMTGKMRPWTPYERAKKRLKTAVRRKVNALRLRMAKSHNR